MFMIRVQHRWCRRHDGTASFGYEIVEPSMPGAHQLSFGALAIGTNVLRALCGPDFRLLQVTFAFDDPQPVLVPVVLRRPSQLRCRSHTQSISMRGGSPRRSRRRTRTFTHCWPTMCDGMLTARTNQPKTGC